MSVRTYSREYLQAIPQERKKQQVDRIIQGFINDIHTAAAVGLTSYRYVRPTTTVGKSYPPDPVLTDAEIIAGFYERFPGCKVYYEEVWVESAINTKTLKKGIVIDWS